MMICPEKVKVKLNETSQRIEKQNPMRDRLQKQRGEKDGYLSPLAL